MTDWLDLNRSILLYIWWDTKKQKMIVFSPIGILILIVISYCHHSITKVKRKCTNNCNSNWIFFSSFFFGLSYVEQIRTECPKLKYFCYIWTIGTWFPLARWYWVCLFSWIRGLHAKFSVFFVTRSLTNYDGLYPP